MSTSLQFLKMKGIALILLFANYLGIAQEKKPVTEATERVKMFSKQAEMASSSPFKDFHWQYIGPTNISGRCTDVEAISPRGKQYSIWVGSATGGVWKSTNEGTTFKPVFDDMPTASVGDIAIDPKNQDVVWVGTGEANIFRSSNAGCGVFKTYDGGESWELKGLENTHTIGRIRIHPDNSNIVYVAATGHEWTPNGERGLYKTADGGETWAKILDIDKNTGVFDIVLDPEDPETIYATSWERKRLKWNDPRTFGHTKNCGIWKSTNGGESWGQINNGLPAAKNRGRIGIDISPANPNVLYALLDNYEIAYKAKEGELDSYGRQKKDVIKGATVYKTTDAGRTWVQTSGLTPESKIYMERHSGTYGWVFGQIRTDPDDENTIYTLGIWLNKSTDGGKTFSTITDPHCDHHGLWIDPANPNYILDVHDGGLSISYDKGESWKHPIEALPLSQFYNITYDYNAPFRIFGSIQDHHSYYGTVDLSLGRDNARAVEFEHTLGAEGSIHVIDPRDNNTLYASVYYGNLARTEVDKYPESTKQVLPPNYPDEPALRGQWVSPITMSAHNNDIIYFGTQYVMMSKDRGGTWEKISPDLTYNDPEKFGDINYQTIQALDESPLLHGLIYAGTDDGRIWRTKDCGKNWKEIRSGAVPQRWVSRITASRYELGTVYMTQTGRRDDDFQVYVWKSTDFGETWQDISGSIPVGPVNVIREDPINPDILYVGTDASVYISKNKGKSWDVLGDLPFAYVHDLQIHPRDNMIIVATHGRGIFIMDANPVNRKEEILKQRRRYRAMESEG